MDAGQYGDDTTRCSSCGHQPGCECSCCAECDDAAALAAERCEVHPDQILTPSGHTSVCATCISEAERERLAAETFAYIAASSPEPAAF